ncbi:MAG TPA: PspC domain-containing protein [Allosphingosinicella sp.]
MQSSQPSLIARDHTLFGVCEALGEDFGFNPFYLRVTLAVMLLWNPIAVIGAYLAAAMIVLVTRFAAPNPRPAPADQAAARPATPMVADEAEADRFAIAA